MAVLTNNFRILFLIGALSITAYCDPGAESNPTGNPIGGGYGYDEVFTLSQANYVVSTAAQLIDALDDAVSGDIIYITDSAEIDLTDEGYEISVPDGVTIASGRGSSDGNGGIISGGLIYTNQLNYPLGIYALFSTGENVRFTGLRLRGPDPEIGDHEYSICRLIIGISGDGENLEVDNCELWGWNREAIRVNAAGVQSHIHHNYIHHCRRVGQGYGVNVEDNIASISALIEANLFDFCRHVIKGSIYSGSYEARYNICLEHGVSHTFDRHGDEYTAGDDTYIHHNTIRNTFMYGAKIRGLPVGDVDITDNWFYHSTETDAIYLYTTENTSVSNNHYDATAPAGTVLPVSQISASPVCGQAPLTVSFSASDPNSEIVSYNWDFADGSADSGDTLNHTFNSSGRYNVTLTITNEDGVPSRYRVPIIVDPQSETYMLSLWLKDSYRGTSEDCYYIQVLVDDNVVWEEDAAGDQGWIHVLEDISTYVSGKDYIELALKVYSPYGVSTSQIIDFYVYWDDIELWGGDTKNGDFESGNSWTSVTNNSSEWRIGPQTGECRGGIAALRTYQEYDVNCSAGSWALAKRKIEILPSELALSLKMDTYIGDMLIDSSVNRNTAILKNGTAVTEELKGGSGCFDGSDDYISISNDDSFDYNSGVTFSMWLYPESFTNKATPSLYSRYYQNDASGYNWIHLTSSGNIRYQFATGTSHKIKELAAGLSLNAWSHITITHDLTNKVLKLYKNGILTDTVTYTEDALPCVTGNACLGSYNNKTTYYPYSGKIDDFRIYTTVLDNSEVKGIYEKKNLAAKLTFNETSGETAYDHSLNVNDGILNAGCQWATGTDDGAVELDGSNGFLTIADNAALNYSNGVTFSMWLYPGSFTNKATPSLYSRYYQNDASGYNWIHLTSSGNIRYQFATGTSHKIKELAAGLSLNVWTHIIITHDLANKVLKLYKNGILTDTVTYTEDALPCVNGHAYLGTYNNKTTYYPYSGKIDDFRIYTAALGSAEIQEIYNSY